MCDGDRATRDWSIRCTHTYSVTFHIEDGTFRLQNKHPCWWLSWKNLAASILLFVSAAPMTRRADCGMNILNDMSFFVETTNVPTTKFVMHPIQMHPRACAADCSTYISENKTLQWYAVGQQFPTLTVVWAPNCTKVSHSLHLRLRCVSR